MYIALDIVNKNIFLTFCALMLRAVIINLLCWVALYWMLLCQMSWHSLWRFKAILFYEM